MVDGETTTGLKVGWFIFLVEKEAFELPLLQQSLAGHLLARAGGGCAHHLSTKDFEAMGFLNLVVNGFIAPGWVAWISVEVWNCGGANIGIVAMAAISGLSLLMASVLVGLLPKLSFFAHRFFSMF